MKQIKEIFEGFVNFYIYFFNIIEFYDLNKNLKA